MPKHVAIILDGNGRWAEKRNLPRSLGHKEGMKTLKELSTSIIEMGIEILSVFAFSTENFNRNKEEVQYLMDLFVDAFEKEKNFFIKNNIKVIFSGKKEPLSDKVYEKMNDLKELTKNNESGTLNICLNYGGKQELIDASIKMHKDLQKGKLKEEEITDEVFNKYLYNELPPIDLLIRTSGEIRVSNFMLYQMAYAEMYFPSTLFPDFKKSELKKAIEEYHKRTRKFGKNIKDKL